MSNMLPMALADDAASQIWQWFRDGTLQRGELYSVPAMAERLGYSRSPVREGLLKLADAGLVEFVRNRGFRVRVPSGRDIAEIFALRLALEPPAARQVALFSHDDAGLVASLRAESQKLRDLAASGTDDEFMAVDQRLHRRVLMATGNRRLVRVIDDLRDATSLLGASTMGRTRTLVEIASEHEPILVAIERGEAARAAMTMRRHLIATGRLLVAQAAADGDARAWEDWGALVDEDD